MISAVIFDMDGVLINSEPYWQQPEIEIFKSVNVDLTREMCLRTMGLRIDEVIKYWFDLYPWSNKPLKELEDEIVERVIHYIKEYSGPMAGVYDALRILKDLNLPLALASSSRFIIIDAVLDKLDIRPYFKVIHSAELEEYGKPHPGIYLSTAQKLGIPPTQCLAIEDSFNGIIAAKAARMKTIAIPEDFMPDQSRFIIADLKLKSLSEISPELINDLSLR